MHTIKTITLHEPFASYIRDGHKRFETRHWKTSYRGLLTIHAGKTVHHTLNRQLADDFSELTEYDNFQSGIVAICRLVHCWPTNNTLIDKISELEYALGDYSPGRYAWELQLLETFDTPIPARGNQGLWDWEPPEGFFDKRVAIVGSRKFPNPHVIDEYVQALPDDTTVVSGGAKGVDSIAEYAAKHRGLQVVSISVLDHEWDLHKNTTSGKSFAGMIRNQAIVDYAGTVTAFHWNGSPGTADTLSKAQKAGKRVIVNPHESPIDEIIPEGRMARSKVLPIAQEFAALISPACEQLKIAGSLRRGKADVKDAELVAVGKEFDDQNALLWVLDRLLEEGTIEKAKLGETGQTRWGNKLRAWVYKGVKFDLFICYEHNFGIQYQLKTGSAKFNITLMTMLKNAPFKLDKFVAYWCGTPLYIPDEKTWFKLLGLSNITAANRNEAYLMQMFGKPYWNGWGDPKKFLMQPKQLMLGGDFVDMFDEGAVIEHLIGKGKLDKHQQQSARDYQWDKPWLIKDGYVWVEDKVQGFVPAEIDSREARLQALKLSGYYAQEYTRNLIAWLEEQQGEIPTPNYRQNFDVEDALPRQFIYERYEKGGASSTSFEEMDLPLEQIQPTQDTIYYAAAKKYYRSGDLFDENDMLPFAIQFQDSPILLLNGHHRYAAQWWRKTKSLRVVVDMLPMTMAQAAGEIEEDDGLDKLEFYADVLEEAFAILQEAKQKDYA